jgi:SAM-dependent methyltransferase
MKESRLRLDWVQRHRAGGSLVDIGCGTGEVITVAAERGFHASGVEPTPWGAEEARRLPGVTAVLPSVEDWVHANPGVRADVATLFHVLEHVHEPAGFLEGIRGMLAPDGLLFIEVPHFGSLAAERDPVAWTGTALDDHVLHYTGGSLGRLLADTGYRVLECTPLTTMVYDDPAYWAQRCRGWLAEGVLTPPEDLLRVLAAPR